MPDRLTPAVGLLQPDLLPEGRCIPGHVSALELLPNAVHDKQQVRWWHAAAAHVVLLLLGVSLMRQQRRGPRGLVPDKEASSGSMRDSKPGICLCLTPVAASVLTGIPSGTCSERQMSGIFTKAASAYAHEKALASGPCS